MVINIHNYEHKNMTDSRRKISFTLSAALEMLAPDAIRLDPWIVEAPLAEGRQWFECLLTNPGNVSKVLLIP